MQEQESDDLLHLTRGCVRFLSHAGEWNSSLCHRVHLTHTLRLSAPAQSCCSMRVCKGIQSKDLHQGNVWETRRGLNPDPRVLCSAHTLLLAAQRALGTCSEPPPEDKPDLLRAENPDSHQSGDGHFYSSESRVMDLAASCGSRSKHQPCWTAAKQ